ncbi:MAG: chaperone NapD [Rubrivivax sp.]
MSILGVIVRCRPEVAEAVARRLVTLPGVELARSEAPNDGRWVLVIEDAPGRSAAAQLAEIALWPEVLGTSLVYEYSGPDSPAPDTVTQGNDWRRGLSADAARP